MRHRALVFLNLSLLIRSVANCYFFMAKEPRMFSQWFSKDKGQVAYPLVSASDVDLAWDGKHALPIPDWAACEPLESLSDAEKNVHWCSAAASWLAKLSTSLSEPLLLRESANFFALSALNERETQVLLEYAERALKRNLATLDAIASDEGLGKHVVMVLPSEDDYYRYVSEYYPQEGEFAFSGGMFIQNGYGHFVFCKGSMDAMEPTLVHELAHALVSHLPLPAWVNEGLAVNTERRWAPRPPQYKPHELAYMHSKFWTPETMQEFWSGKSYLRTDDGNALSYDLAQRMIEFIGRDHELLARFVNQSTSDDGASQAALEVLGIPLAEITQEVIGASFVAPDPSQWNQGAEKGWF